MTGEQDDLFADDRATEAALRRHAWQRYEQLEQLAAAAAGPVDQALALDALATARLAYDLADGLAHEIEDTTGLAFCGYLRETQ